MKRYQLMVHMILCLSLLLSGVLVVGGRQVSAAVVTRTYQEEGQRPITYSYNDATKVLTFSGSGVFYSAPDWEEWEKIKKYKPEQIVLSEGFEKIEANSLCNFWTVKKVVLPESLRVIGGYAFGECENLEKINMPSKLRKIGTRAFCYDKNLKKITLPEKLKVIKEYAFSRSGITEITVPKGVDVKSYAFSNCEKLKKVVYGGTKLPMGLFYRSKNLTEVQITSKPDSISQYAFSECGIKQIKLPSSIKTIESRAFYKCEKLESIKIPKRVKSIEKATFRNCMALSDLTIGKNVEIIKENAFKNCNLGALTIPGNVLTLDYGAFRKAGINSVILEDGIETIGDWAFSENRSIETVTIPETVSTIEDNAFTYCTSLKEILVDPENGFFTSIDGMLFSKDETKLIICPAGTEGTVTIPSSVVTLTEYSLHGCDKVTAYALSGENSIYSVKDGVLYDVLGTTIVRYPQGITGKINIPIGVTLIDAYSFSGSLADEITIPYTVTKIGVSAFSDCDNMKSIVIPGNVTTIAAAAFWNCDELEKVKIESGCEHIRRLAFSDCWKLESVRIPTSVSTIALTAFSDVSMLTIYCPKQSYALAFAKKNWIRYKLV